MTPTTNIAATTSRPSPRTESVGIKACHMRTGKTGEVATTDHCTLTMSVVQTENNNLSKTHAVGAVCSQEVHLHTRGRKNVEALAGMSKPTNGSHQSSTLFKTARKVYGFTNGTA